MKHYGSIFMTIILSLFTIHTAYAQMGTEFQINTTTEYNQMNAQIASDGTNYLIVWESYKQDGDSTGIFARLYNNMGDALTPELQINTYTTYAQNDIQVASNASNYLIIWRSQLEGGIHSGLYGRFVDNDGTVMGTAFQVSTAEYSYFSSLTSNGVDYAISYAYDVSGSYQVAFKTISSSSSISTEHLVMSLDEECTGVSIAFDGTNYMITAPRATRISTSLPIDREEVYYRIMRETGSAVISKRIVSTLNQVDYYDGYLELDSHDLAFDGENYMVAWLENDISSAPDEYLYDIYYRYITPSGTRIGSEKLLNEITVSFQDMPSLCPIPGQGVMAVWQSVINTSTEVVARPIGQDGIGFDEFQVNTFATGGQSYPQIASQGGETVCIVWSSYYQDGNGSGVFGTIFGKEDDDNDDLPLLYELMHGIDPENPDTDDDTLTDGEEVNIYGTDPLSNDTDNDLLRDALEIDLYGTNPNMADSDNDDLTDWEEIVLTRSDPLDEDSDNDGLLDGEEMLDYFTDPNNPDSDSDGVSDYDEIIAGTNPNDGLDFLAITRFEELSAYLGVDVIFIGWNSAPRKVYRVYVQTDMIGPDFVLLEDNLESKGYQTFYMDQGGGPNSIPHPSLETGVRMYRVTVKE